MPIPLYLAMTAAEFYHCNPLPEKIAWMACHFSPYGTGITNCPTTLPPGSLLILNDRTPVCGHDPQRVAGQIAQLAEAHHCAGILLDLQRVDNPLEAKVVQAICRSAPCPVAVTEFYCRDCDCAVFLSPPLHIPLDAVLSSWHGREIWLEAATEDMAFRITEDGCTKMPLPCPPDSFPHTAEGAFSRYHISVEKDTITFSFQRTSEDLQIMGEKANDVRCMVGLYQQIK